MRLRTVVSQLSPPPTEDRSRQGSCPMCQVGTRRPQRPDNSSPRPFVLTDPAFTYAAIEIAIAVRRFDDGAFGGDGYESRVAFVAAPARAATSSEHGHRTRCPQWLPTLRRYLRAIRRSVRIAHTPTDAELLTTAQQTLIGSRAVPST